MFLAVPARSATCSAKSSERTAALVELYTVEGCARCAAAERRIAALEGELVPIVLHLHAPTAKPEAILRERRFTPRQRLAMASSPLLLLQGREHADWRPGVLERAVAAINARPAKVRLRLEILDAHHGPELTVLTVRVSADLLEAAPAEELELFLAAHENRRVAQWLGPVPLGEPPRMVDWRLQTASPSRGAAAFVQSRRSREVLQAVNLPACP